MFSARLKAVKSAGVVGSAKPNTWILTCTTMGASASTLLPSPDGVSVIVVAWSPAVASGGACTSDGASICASCDDGFELEGQACVETDECVYSKLASVHHDASGRFPRDPYFAGHPLTT